MSAQFSLSYQSRQGKFCIRCTHFKLNCCLKGHQLSTHVRYYGLHRALWSIELEQGYLICHNPCRVVNSFFSAYHILATYEFNLLHNGKICFFAKNSTFLTNADVWCLLKPDVVIPSTKSGIFLEQANVVFFFQPHECLCHVQS